MVSFYDDNRYKKIFPLSSIYLLEGPLHLNRICIPHLDPSLQGLILKI